MSLAIIIIYINITNFVLNSLLEKDHSIKAHRLTNVIFIQAILSFLLSRKIINIYIDIAWKFGNATVTDFRKYEKLECKKNKLKLETFSTITNNLACIQNYLSLNCRMFLIKTRYQFVKDSFAAPSISLIRNSNIFQKTSVYPKTFYLNSFLLLTTTSLQNL